MKNALITGTSSGFGYLTALTLARNGYKVWATMRNPDDKNKEKKQTLLTIAQEESLDIEVVELDITSDASVDALARHIINEGGNLDILINNAGVMYVGITEAYSLEQVKAQFDTNFYGVIRTSKAFLPLLRASQNGLIINVSSIGGRLVFPYFGIYCASKFALEAYSEALKYELKPLGIDVTVIEPGPFPTALLYSGPKENDTEVLDIYGDMSTTPAAMLKSFDDFFNSENTPNPQEVADSILEVIQTPKGNRPIRTAVGVDYQTNTLNREIAPIQSSLIKDSLNMEHLL